MLLFLLKAHRGYEATKDGWSWRENRTQGKQAQKETPKSKNVINSMLFTVVFLTCVCLFQGMDLSHDHLMSISYTHGDAHIRPLDNEITNLKRQIQANKQIISQNKYQVEVGIDDFRLGDVSTICLYV